MLEKVATKKVIEYVHPDTLKFAPFNPRLRTESRAVAKLKQQIEKAGEIIVPLVITQDNYVADGHRRLTVARELNIESVPVIRKEWVLDDLWSILNTGNMSISPKTWMQCVREGMPIEYVPEKNRKMLSDLIRVVGRKMYDKMTDDGHGPQIITVAQYVAGYLKNDDDKFIREVIKWFVDCKTLRDAKVAVSTGCPPEIILAAIEGRTGVKHYWGPA